MPDQQDADTPQPWKGPLSWGLAAAAIAGAAYLLAMASPLLFAAGVATLTLAAVVQGAADYRAARMNNHRSESWETQAAKIAACLECVDRVAEETPGRFQAMVSQEQAGQYLEH